MTDHAAHGVGLDVAGSPPLTEASPGWLAEASICSRCVCLSSVNEILLHDEVFFATGYYYPVFLRTCRRRYSSAKEGVGLRIASVSVEAHFTDPCARAACACQRAPNRREVLYCAFFPPKSARRGVGHFTSQTGLAWSIGGTCMSAWRLARLTLRWNEGLHVICCGLKSTRCSQRQPGRG